MRTRGLPTSMDCYDFVQQIDTFIDGELEMSEHAAMETHSAVCVECNDKEARRRNTRQRLRATAEQFTPSMDFMARLQTAIDEKPAPQSAPVDAKVEVPHEAPVDDVPAVQEQPPQEAPAVFDYVSTHWRIFALAATALVALTVGLTVLGSGNSDDTTAMVAGSSAFASPVVGESVAWHRRSVPVEVVGPDAQTVRRWFTDKVSFAVVLPEFENSARLLGGRLSHVRQYEAAYLLYEVDGSKLSVLLFDAGELNGNANFRGKTFVDNSNGYNVAIREKSGLTYTFTSDMDAKSLADLVDGTMSD